MAGRAAGRKDLRSGVRDRRSATQRGLASGNITAAGPTNFVGVRKSRTRPYCFSASRTAGSTSVASITMERRVSACDRPPRPRSLRDRAARRGACSAGCMKSSGGRTCPSLPGRSPRRKNARSRRSAPAYGQPVPPSVAIVRPKVRTPPVARGSPGTTATRAFRHALPRRASRRPQPRSARRPGPGVARFPHPSARGG